MNLKITVKGGSIGALLKNLITVQKHLLSGIDTLDKGTYSFKLESASQ